MLTKLAKDLAEEICNGRLVLSLEGNKKESHIHMHDINSDRFFLKN